MIIFVQADLFAFIYFDDDDDDYHYYYYYYFIITCIIVVMFLFELVMHIMYYVNSVIISLSFLGPMLMEAVASSPKEGAAFP